MILRDSLKAGIISEIYLTEGMNDSVEAKVLCQLVGVGWVGGLCVVGGVTWRWGVIGVKR